MSIQRTINGYRLVETWRGDTLQSVAFRELGNSSRWPELVSFNGLLPPFLTDDPSEASATVLLTGGLIKVPAAEQIATSNTRQDDAAVFEVDVGLSAGQITANSGGDFDVAEGTANLRQALANRLDTDTGELGFHPEYGSQLRRIVGTVNGPTAGLLAASYAKSAVLQDPRVARVASATATPQGDQVQVAIVAEPIVGQAVDVTQSV